MIKKFFALAFFLSLSLFSPSVFAAPNSDIFFVRGPALPGNVYGISGSIELLPKNISIDEPIQLTLGVDQVKFDHHEDYDGHIGLFREEGFDHFFVPGAYDSKKKITSAFVSTTGLYVFAPIVPQKKDFALHLSKTDLTVEEEFTVTSDPILSTSGDPIWDGFPFVVTGSNFEILGVPFDAKAQEASLKAKDGKIQFNAKIHTPTTGVVATKIEVTSRDFGTRVGHGEISVENVKGTTTFVRPPAKLRVKNHLLVWQPSPDRAIYLYQIDYRLQGDTAWSSFGQVAGKKHQIDIKIPFARTFEFRVSATDVTLNKSEFSNIAVYKQKKIPTVIASAPEAKTPVAKIPSISKISGTGSVVFISKALSKGMQDAEVTMLQKALTILGHYHGPISGTYDDATMKAVYGFQVKEGIVKTPFNPKTNGSLGDKTRNVLNAKKVKG